MAQLSVVFYTEMATITLNDDAPEVQEDSPLTFSIGNNEPIQFAESNAKFETDEPDVLAAASAHPWLEVTHDVSTSDTDQQQTFDDLQQPAQVTDVEGEKY